MVDRCKCQWCCLRSRVVRRYTIRQSWYFTYLLLCAGCSSFPVGIHGLILQSCSTKPSRWCLSSSVRLPSLVTVLRLHTCWLFVWSTFYMIRRIPLSIHVMLFGFASPDARPWLQLFVSRNPCQFHFVIERIVSAWMFLLAHCFCSSYLCWRCVVFSGVVVLVAFLM